MNNVGPDAGFGAAAGGVVAAGTGQRVGLPVLPVFLLDRVWVTEYVGFHGVGSSGHPGCLGRSYHNLWLGTAHAAQPTLTPESRHLFCFHRKPYC